MTQTPSVAVIGAGIAGAACAQALSRAGVGVRIFDKGRALGGRLATRRTGAWQWDHGAQSISAKDASFARLVSNLPDWSSDAPALGKVGSPAQNQIVKAMLDGLSLKLDTRVTQLSRAKPGDWRIRTSDSSVYSGFDAIALAVPAPQAQALINNVRVFPELVGVQMDPCWALMVATPRPLTLPRTLSSPHEHIAWLAADHTKPDRPDTGGQYVLHATAAWSERHLEMPGNVVKAHLLGYFNELAGAVEVSYACAHRWRYGLTALPLAQPCLYQGSLALGVCGDWCLGSRVEHGFLSGRALADRIARALLDD